MESLGTLAGGIAHDFNNLLMGIQGRASLMAMEVGPEHRFYEHIHEIGDYVKSAADLTRQLLGFARGGKYEVIPIDFNKMVRSSADMFARTRREIRIRTELTDPLPAVEADRHQLEQVLLNIYVNAWQAMPHGGTLTIRTFVVRLDDSDCRPHGVCAGDFVCSAISDTGIGMDPAVQERIFDPFFTTKEKGRGTGLGLASAFGIIKNHNGFITVDSQVGRGTTFTIHLPSSQRPVRSEAVAKPVVQRGSERILLVDDEEMVRTVGRAMLETLGYRVRTAASGEAAMKILKAGSEPVDLVILDLIMPGWDGGQTADRMWAVDPQLRVLLSSGYAIDGQAEAVMKKGCSGFIQKPFTIQELATKVRAILGTAD
jgi:CheY-like chemotaxis protein